MKTEKIIENGIEYEVGIYNDGDRHWYLNGVRHREDGPAIEYANGDKSWYQNGERHRLDGPAIEDVEGNKEWCLNGELHREDGPAIECVNGYKEWYLNDIEYSEDEFNSKIPKQKQQVRSNEIIPNRWTNLLKEN